MSKKMKYDEIFVAEAERSLMAIVESWENDELTLEQMSEQLEAAVALFEGEVDYNDLIEKLGIKGIKHS